MQSNHSLLGSESLMLSITGTSCSLVMWPISSHRVGMLKVTRCACLLSLMSISGGTSTDVSGLLRTQIGHRQPLLAFSGGSASWGLCFFVGDKGSLSIKVAIQLSGVFKKDSRNALRQPHLLSISISFFSLHVFYNSFQISHHPLPTIWSLYWLSAEATSLLRATSPVRVQTRLMMTRVQTPLDSMLCPDEVGSSEVGEALGAENSSMDITEAVVKEEER